MQRTVYIETAMSEMRVREVFSKCGEMYVLVGLSTMF